MGAAAAPPAAPSATQKGSSGLSGHMGTGGGSGGLARGALDAKASDMHSRADAVQVEAGDGLAGL
eukprot:10720397-Lingulodinium_polyedra.AAC.1